MYLHQPSAISEYTEESLDKMLKRDLIPIVLNLQSTVAEKNNSYNEFLDEIRKFNNNFSKRKSELAVTKQVTTELAKRIVTLGRQYWVNSQYSSRECLEVVGIPRQVDDNQLETKYFQFLRSLVAKLILVLLMTVIVLARIMAEL